MLGLPSPTNLSAPPVIASPGAVHLSRSARSLRAALLHRFIARTARKTQLMVGYAPHNLLPLVEEAMRCFAKRKKFAAGNDDSISLESLRPIAGKPSRLSFRGDRSFDSEICAHQFASRRGGHTEIKRFLGCYYTLESPRQLFLLFANLSRSRSPTCRKMFRIIHLISQSSGSRASNSFTASSEIFIPSMFSPSLLYYPIGVSCACRGFHALQYPLQHAHVFAVTGHRNFHRAFEQFT